MRVVLQRCSRAQVRIDDKVVGQIGRGFLLLVGITDGDTQAEAELLAKKVAQMRVFEDAEGKMNLGLQEVNGAILSISQFTLYADCRKGNRPSFIRAARPETAIPLYELFLKRLAEISTREVQSGEFGAMMAVELLNDGPVTIIIDSKNRE